MGNTISQVFPPKPSFTEKDLPDLQGKAGLLLSYLTGHASNNTADRCTW